MSTITAFEYTALDKKGIKCKGVARAATEVDAYRQVSAAGLTPVKIKPAKEGTVRRDLHVVLPVLGAGDSRELVVVFKKTEPQVTRFAWTEKKKTICANASVMFAK